jgi:hypothetical protein
MTLTKEIRAEWAAVGGLSSPSKMPCYGYGLPASSCKAGSKLRALPGNTVCSHCYACKGRYTMGGVPAAQARRLESLRHLGRWQDFMTRIIRKVETSGYFRWHDSGDLQSVEHARAIANIARELPGIRFWLPTREIAIVKAAGLDSHCPENLTIRYAMAMVGQPEPEGGKYCYSGVYKGSETAARLLHAGPGTVFCPSASTGGKCGQCRACWSREVRMVWYKLH